MADSVSITARRERIAAWPPSFLERPNVLGPVLIAPALIYSGVLVAYPFILAIYLSLSNADVATSGLGQFVGLDNFAALFVNPVFLTALRNTLMFTG